MSHFTVLAVGANYKQEMEKYWELDLSPEEIKNDPRAKFIDKTSEYLDDYKNKRCEMYYMLDSKRLLLKHELTKKELSENKYIIKNLKLCEIYPKFEDYLVYWVGYTKDNIPKDGKYGYYSNPNAKWDWYQIGGRWKGFFKLKDLNNNGILGDEGAFGPNRTNYAGRADQALKFEIDFSGMRDDVEKEQSEKYDNFHSLLNGRDIPIWSEFVKNFSDINVARDEYWKNEVIVDVSKYFYNYECYLKPKDIFIKEERDSAIVTYALLYNGNWYEKGNMGWWGISSNEKKQEEWNIEFNKIIDSLSDDTLLTLIDCHI